MNIEGNCPHCKKDVSIDIDKLEVKTEAKPLLSNASTLVQTQVLEQKPVETIKEKIKTVAPSDEPYYHCEGENCMGLHKNPNYKVRPNKKCTNCSTLNSPKAKGCKNCKKDEFDELTDEDLDELEIPKPEMHDHSHED